MYRKRCRGGRLCPPVNNSRRTTMENLYNETKFILNKYGIHANKSLGQNFLINNEVVSTIIESANISNKDLVIEIGPGLGTLTSRLLEKAGKVICVELDDRMISILEDRFKLYNNFELIHNDVLKVDLNKIIEENIENSNLKTAKIVANLPYYITTPIIMKLLEEKLNIETITVMIQKEVADRLVALPGTKNAGAITYSVYYYADAIKIIDVEKNSFIPEPNVTSTVIQLKIRKESLLQVENEELMFKIIKQAFMQRRKTLVNALSNLAIFNNKEEIIQLLKELNINEKVRGEALTIEQYAKITNRILKKIEN